MQHLTPVGLSKDGKSLVLVSDAGEEFAVPVDHRLRAALRGDHARLGQLEMKMESTLRPRDIQARIRAGESAEDVAAAAQTTVDAIMAFAAPVLAERAHVAESARSPRSAAGPPRVHRRRHPRPGLRAPTSPTLGVRADDVDWDAWRREDGRWTLVADTPSGGSARRAEFTYDQPGRYVVAENDEARLLTGEATRRAPGAARRPGGSPRSPATACPRRRRAAAGRRRAGPIGSSRPTDQPGRRRDRAGPRPRPTTSSPPTTADAGLDRRRLPRPAPTSRAAVDGEPRPGTSRSTRSTDEAAGRGARPRSRSRAGRLPPKVAQEGTLLGAELGRDHVRRRQVRVSPGSRRATVLDR